MIRAKKEEAMEVSVMLTSHLVTIEKPLSIMTSIWKLQKKLVIGAEKDKPMEILVMLTSHWVTIQKPLSIMKNN